MPEEMPVELWRGFKPNNAMWRGSVVEIFVAPESAMKVWNPIAFRSII